MILIFMRMNVPKLVFLSIMKEEINSTMQKMRMEINFRCLIREIM